MNRQSENICIFNVLDYQDPRLEQIGLLLEKVCFFFYKFSMLPVV